MEQKWGILWIDPNTITNEEERSIMVPQVIVKKSAAKSAVAKKTDSKPVAAAAAEIPPIMLMPLGSIKKHPDLKKRITLTGIEELAASIAESGLIMPLGVITDGGKTHLVCGERRLMALKRVETDSPRAFAKWFKGGIPVRPVASDVVGAQLVQLSENVQREDYTPIEIANDIEELVKKGLTTEQIAKRIGKSPTYVRNYNRFSSEASPQLKKAVAAGSVNFADALVLMKRPAEEQMASAKEIAEAKELPRKEREEKKRKVKALAKSKTTEEKAAKKPSAKAEKAPEPSAMVRTKKEIVTVLGAVKEETFKAHLVRKFTVGHVLYAALCALRYTIGAMDEVKLANILNDISGAYDAEKETSKKA